MERTLLQRTVAASSGNTEETDGPHRPAIIWIFPRGPQCAGKYTLCYLLASAADKPLNVIYTHSTDEKEG